MLHTARDQPCRDQEEPDEELYFLTQRESITDARNCVFDHRKTIIDSARLPLTCTIRSVQPVTILVRCLCYPGRALESQHQDILRRLYVRALSIDHRLYLCVRPHIYRFIVHRQWTIHLRGPL